MKFNLTLLISLLLYSYVDAQMLDIGQKYADIKLDTLLNFTSTEANLSALNDKPLIIDFWFTTCGSCIRSIPDLDSLHKVYGGKFNVLLATHNNMAEVIRFCNKNKVFSKIKLPIATSIGKEAALRKMFDHIGEPHEVWISKDGVIQAITSQYEITPENLERFIKGEKLNLPLKREAADKSVAWGEQPLFITDRQYNAGKKGMLYSYLGNADPLLLDHQLAAFRNDSCRILCQNCDVARLYAQAYRTRGNQERFKVEEAFANPEKFKPNPRTLKNLYCYEIVLKDSSEMKTRKFMQRDLDNFFAIKSSIKLQKTRYYILSKMGESNKFMAKTDAKSKINFETDSVKLLNADIEYLVSNRLYNNLPYGVINETGYMGRIEMAVPKTTDINALKRHLNKYGLDINLGYRDEEVLVLEDAK